MEELLRTRGRIDSSETPSLYPRDTPHGKGKSAMAEPVHQPSDIGRSLLSAMMVAVLALLVFLPGFTALPPMDRDESRFAQATKQMLESRDFVDIRFQDEPRHKKPIGIYWLQSASVSLVGPEAERAIWAYRLPSLLAAVLACLTIWAIGRHLFSDGIGVTAALFFMATVLIGFEARQAKSDAMLLAFILLAQAVLAKIYTSQRSDAAPSKTVSALFWVFIGLGILIKGPIILLITGLTVVALSIWERSTALIRALHPLRGLAIALVLCAPWFIAIAIVTNGQFFVEAVGTDLLGKVTSGQESHGAPPGYYLLTSWGALWPFAVFALPALIWALRRREAPAVRFLLCWIVPSWIAFELFATKLPHYVLPLYPAILLLAAAAMADRFTGAGPWHVWVLRFSVILSGIIALALIGAAFFLPIAYGQGLSAWSFLSFAAGATALAGLVWLWRFPLEGPSRPVLIALMLAGVAMPASVFQGVLPAATQFWVSSRLAQHVDAHRETCPDAVFGIQTYSEPSLIFLTGKDTVFVSAAGAARLLAADKPCPIVAINAEDRAQFERTAADLKIQPQQSAALSGFNYNGGDPVNLLLFTRSPTPPSAVGAEGSNGS